MMMAISATAIMSVRSRNRMSPLPHEVNLDGEKVSGTVLRLLRPVPRLHGRFQTQSGYSPVNPGLSTKWRTACNAPVQRLQFRLGLRGVYMIGPVGFARRRPGSESAAGITSSRTPNSFASWEQPRDGWNSRSISRGMPTCDNPVCSHDQCVWIVVKVECRHRGPPDLGLPDDPETISRPADRIRRPTSSGRRLGGIVGAGRSEASQAGAGGVTRFRPGAGAARVRPVAASRLERARRQRAQSEVRVLGSIPRSIPVLGVSPCPNALPTVNLRVGVPPLGGPDRLKAGLQPPDRTLTKH
jgi:hypothetical protein